MLVSLWQENIRVLESTFSQQTVKLFEVIQEVEQNTRNESSGFLQKKKKKKDKLIKRKNGFIICVNLPNSISLVDGLCYEIIESSNLQEIFSSVSKC